MSLDRIEHGKIAQKVFLIRPKIKEQMKRATAWDPFSPPFLCAQAEVEDQVGQLTNALKTLDYAESVTPNDRHIPYIRATVLLRNSRYGDARTAVNRALKIQPDFEPALELQGEISGKTH